MTRIAHDGTQLMEQRRGVVVALEEGQRDYTYSTFDNEADDESDSETSLLRKQQR